MIWHNITVLFQKGGVFLKEYVLLSSLYYNHKDQYEELYQTRIHSVEFFL